MYGPPTSASSASKATTAGSGGSFKGAAGSWTSPKPFASAKPRRPLYRYEGNSANVDCGSLSSWGTRPGNRPTKPAGRLGGVVSKEPRPVSAVTRSVVESVPPDGDSRVRTP